METYFQIGIVKDTLKPGSNIMQQTLLYPMNRIAQDFNKFFYSSASHSPIGPVISQEGSHGDVGKIRPSSSITVMASS